MVSITKGRPITRHPTDRLEGGVSRQEGIGSRSREALVQQARIARTRPPQEGLREQGIARARHPGGGTNYGLLPGRPGALRESTDLPHLWSAPGRCSIKRQSHPDHKAESACSRTKERHEFRRGLTASDQGGQDQGKKNHSADPADGRKHMEPDQEDHHPPGRSIGKPTLFMPIRLECREDGLVTEARLVEQYRLNDLNRKDSMNERDRLDDWRL